MTAAIDRRSLVDRHAVVHRSLDPRAPLSVGNGELACTVDVTGLHTLAAAYPAPGRGGETPGSLLGIQSQWGWHTIPHPPGRSAEPTLAVAKRPYRTPRGTVDYVDLSGRTSTTSVDAGTAAETWLRNNPHRLLLAQVQLDPGCVGLDAAGPIAAGVVTDVDQRLDLWSGILTSHTSVAGRPLSVITAADPEHDAIGWRITGPSRPSVRIAFPYGSEAWGNAADWQSRDRHRTRLLGPASGGAIDDLGYRVLRTLDGDRYEIGITAPGAEVEQTGPHEVTVVGGAGGLDLVIGFAVDEPITGLGVDELLARSRRWWSAYWSDGGALELADSDAPQAGELERRVVLSSYLTMINCAGSAPPQETGLMVNSWRGRPHLEMHWWHAAHFPVWGRPELLERSLGWYGSILGRARATAAEQRLTGARWPKQVGPDGAESPSDIGPFLIWQQPHPVHLAELVRRARPDDQSVLHRYAELVFATADFMASYASERADGFHLGPPLIPAQECYADLRREAVDPTFELAYWGWALDRAQDWRRRLGLAPEPTWAAVSAGLVPPTVRAGRYAALGIEPYLRRRDHPSMVAALGVVPATRTIDPAVMGRTLDDVLVDWDWASTWGWDYPMLAMTATRLGRPEDALALLLRPEAKNTYLANGHNHQTPALPVYLPGNGGLLTATALMAAGWDGSPDRPGFGAGWSVQHEGIQRLP